MTPGLTVLIVDDHTLIGEMLATEIVSGGGEAEAIDEAAQAAAAATRLRPDVAVIDIDLPGTSGFEVAEEVRAATPDTRIIFLSAYVRDAYVERAMDIQVDGYLAKSEPLNTVLEAIESVAAGERRFSESVLRRIVIGPAGATTRTTRAASLTERERAVLEQVARGLSQKQVAAALDISIKTVQHHLAHVMDKLGLHDRVELARFAIREGLIEP